MKTFKDLVFNEKESMLGGFQARMDFKNGYGVSVISGFGSYSEGGKPYELAVFYDGHLCYDTPVTNDVIGCLTPKLVTNCMKRVQLLPKKENL